jgi:cation transport ATPase
LVPQKRRLLALTALERRRIRRIADARPVTDEVVERFIMVCACTCAFWRAVIAVSTIGCAAGASSGLVIRGLDE